MKVNLHCVAIVAIILLLQASAEGANPVDWHIVEQINRTDTMKSWQSPTAIDLGKMVWEYDYEITKVTGTVSVPLVGNVTEDVTDSISPELRSASGETRSLPAVLVNQSIVEPSTGTSADVFVEVDSLGFGRAVFSNIMLGSVDVPLFGSRPIERINIEAIVSLVGYDFGDYNRDGSVDAADYVVWRGTLGHTGDDLWADGNWNNAVDSGDFNIWRDHLGQTAFAGGSFAAASVPEPATAALLLLVPLTLTVRRKRPGRLLLSVS
jgi:hypothetical protein